MCVLNIEILHNGNEEKPYIKMISFDVDDTEINILKNNSDSIIDRNLELLTYYAFALKEINDDTKSSKHIENIELATYNERR